MKVTRLESVIIGNPWKNWVLIRLETDQGIEGVGEATLEHRTLATQRAIDELAAYVLGTDPADVEHLLFRMRLETYTPGILINTVASAFEMACWDVLGKYHREPVYRLLGGKFREAIPVYANGWYRVERQPEAFAAAAERVLDTGYRALKFDPFGAIRGSLDRREFDLSLAIIDAVARTCDARDAAIIVEGHARFDLPTAKRLARAIEPYHPLWFEEPVLPEDLQGIKEVRASTCVPIAAGERLVELVAFTTLLHETGVDIVQPDIAHVGGLVAARKIAAVAEGFSRSATFHSPLSPVVTAASLQLAALCPNFDWQEVFDHFNEPWAVDIFGAPPPVVNGCVALPRASGLGISVNWEAARAHPYSEVFRQNMFRAGWERRQGVAASSTGVETATGH